MADTAAEAIEVEVAYALPGRQLVLRLKVTPQTSLLAAVLASGIADHFPELDVHAAKLGVFGRVVADPTGQPVRPGDRIEIYRPLLADPKLSRARRAARRVD